MKKIFWIKKFSDYRYHLIHRQRAKCILNNIESQKGKLDPSLIKLSDEYANDVFGWRGYAPWLYVYSAISQCFKEGWIPDNYYGKVVIPATKREYGKISDLKALASKLFKDDLVPDVCYYVNGLWLSNSYEVIRGEKIKDILFKDSGKVVFKRDCSLQGKGVFILDRISFDPKTTKHLGNGVFQIYIKQHQLFEEFVANSVSTLRMTTILEDSGCVSLRACYLRVGLNADTHVKSSSHIRIPVDLAKGELDAKGYLANWLVVDKHPDTKTIFKGKKIPSFDKCISTVLNLHKSIPFIRCVGWDVVVDRNNNVKVMEWNGGHNDIKFSEATQGPCFADLGWERLWRNS
ncbi:MAG: sugar-transfer associated ATP-grasp domain-containing protein [bacterium]|nr:sugar-transfer associated ATP-grasp domain-containing protein [bacterium]